MHYLFNQGIRNSNDFLLCHKHIFKGTCALWFLGILGSTLIGKLYSLAGGTLLSSLGEIFIEGGISALRVFALSELKITYTWVDRIFTFFISQTFLYYIEIAIAVYLLSALRGREVCIGKALKTGLKLAIKSWEILLSVQLIAFMLSYTDYLYIMLHVKTNALPIVINFILSTIFSIYIFFIDELIVDGETDLRETSQKSLRYARTYLTPILLLILFLYAVEYLTAFFFSSFFDKNPSSLLDILGILCVTISTFLMFLTGVTLFYTYKNKLYLMLQTRENRLV